MPIFTEKKTENMGRINCFTQKALFFLTQKVSLESGQKKLRSQSVPKWDKFEYKLNRKKRQKTQY